jgi:hypothetical protein
MARQLTIPQLTERLSARDVNDTSDIRQLADWLDTRFVIPGTNLRFGLDSLIGLVPGLGDAVTALLSLYIVKRAYELRAPGWLIARMLANTAIDSVLGAIPLFGDLFDFAFRSNTKNIRLLLRHLEQREARTK